MTDSDGSDDGPPDGATTGEGSEPGTGAAVARGLIVAAGTVLAAGVGWVLFVVVPGSIADLLGVLLAAGVALAGLRGAANVARSRFPDYNVAEVAVDGPITRDGGRPGPLGGMLGIRADEVVEQIEAADNDPAVDALLVRLNTPGGEVVPSEEICAAAASFDGPTVAEATDVCASGGYWIASGCDELWAREASLVGSIGVIGSRPNVAGLADRLGVSYERLVAGQYKDAGNPLKEPTEAEREYLQGLIDGFYDDFVERVAAGRDLDAEAVRETEARVYLGGEAADYGLVDEVGTRDDVEDRLADYIGVEPSIAVFEPERGLRDRIGVATRRVARAAGAGVGDVLASDDEVRIRL